MPLLAVFRLFIGLGDHSLRRIKAISGSFFVAIWALFVSAQDDSAPLDPSAWGADHVGKPIPMYMTGDECLFCHRTDVGATLQSEPHNASMRVVETASPTMKKLLASVDAQAFGGEVAYLLGGERQRRFLKPNGSYGQVAIHAAKWTPGADGAAAATWVDTKGGWDVDLFATRCAGCHATAVETEWKAFSAISLECFVCHGDTPPGHQNEPGTALFAKEGEPEPLVEMSTCGQCHLRGGQSMSSGLPYPNQFVPGDNLFRDYEVDWSETRILGLNPGDRHVYRNVKDVVVEGRLDLRCTTCHDVHGRSTRKHRVLKRLQRERYCAICHDDLEDYASFLHYEVHSEVCQY